MRIDLIMVILREVWNCIQLLLRKLLLQLLLKFFFEFFFFIFFIDQHLFKWIASLVVLVAIGVLEFRAICTRCFGIRSALHV